MRLGRKALSAAADAGVVTAGFPAATPASADVARTPCSFQRRPRGKGTTLRISHIARLGLVAATVLTGIGASAGSASATVTNYGCRSDNTGGTYVNEPGNIGLDSCGEPGEWSDSIYARVVLDARGSTGGDPCAQLMRVNSNGSLTMVHNYGCGGWQPLGWTEWDTFYTDSFQPGRGTYVVQAGFWAQPPGLPYGYYGNVQSPRVTVS